MIEAEFSTAAFIGVGGILCRHCDRKLWFPENCAVLRFHFDGAQMITDATTKEVYHDCRRPKEFYCPECEFTFDPAAGPLPTQKLSRTGMYCVLGSLGRQPNCPFCGSDLRQRPTRA